MINASKSWCKAAQKKGGKRLEVERKMGTERELLSSSADEEKRKTKIVGRKK